MNAAMNARLSKERSPAIFCAEKNCLWLEQTNKGFNPCQKHRRRVAVCVQCSKAIYEGEDKTEVFLAYARNEDEDFVHAKCYSAYLNRDRVTADEAY